MLRLCVLKVSLFLFSVALLAGCGGSSSGSSQFVLTDFLWRSQSIKGKTGGDVPCPADITIQTTPLQLEFSCDAEDYTVFNSNGTFTGSGTNAGSSGTWSLSGTVLTMTVVDTSSSPSTTAVGTFELSGSATQIRATQKSFTFNGERETDLDGTSTVLIATNLPDN